MVNKKEEVWMTTSLEIRKTQDSVPIVHYDAVVVGAGPYGLATAAHLSKRGLNVAIFGKPISLWREHMPKGMLLRSYWWATNISDPAKRYNLEHYFRENDQQAIDPLPVETFIEYGLWFQRHAVGRAQGTE
jgi:cation diffusion facilitator CzcD-associated flavoprotein CzcO